MEHSRESQTSLTGSTRPALDNAQKNTSLNESSSSENLEGLWNKYSIFVNVIVTTIISGLLLANAINGWTDSGRYYLTVTSNRASTQLAVQLISYLLGLSQVTAICRTINYATRLRMERDPVPLDTIRLWSLLSGPRMDWGLRLQSALPLLAFISITSVPAVIWAGAITPVPTPFTRETTVNVPQYNNMSLIREYSSESNKRSIIVRTQGGMVTYSVGMKDLGSLLSSAATATLCDDCVRKHPKYDNTGFIYVGRSYGVGSSVGLTIDLQWWLEHNPVVSYTYSEMGYEPMVHCIYNQSSEFVLREGKGMLHTAGGRLPDSNEHPDYSVYVGHDTSAMVAIGVAHAITSPRRYLAIAAGRSYAMLNATQCTVDFIPSRFDVSVYLPGQLISVVRLSDAPDIDPSRNLTKTAMGQFELFSIYQTNPYVSHVGDSFYSSIVDYMSLSGFSSPILLNLDSSSKEEAALAGLTNSLTAMIDDMLVSYASAQLMIAQDMRQVPATVTFNALRLGQDVYIYTIAVINGLVVICVLWEAVRTRGWKELSRFNYLDPKSLIVAALRGERDAVDATSDVERLDSETSKTLLRKRNDGIGDMSVILRTSGNFALVLTSREAH